MQCNHRYMFFFSPYIYPEDKLNLYFTKSYKPVKMTILKLYLKNLGHVINQETLFLMIGTKTCYFLTKL